MTHLYSLLSLPLTLSLPFPTTADDPTKAPVQPINTPAIFFDTQSESPWEFSLNLSSVLPDSSTQLRPNSTGLVINGFVLQITVERDGMNITDNHYMVSSNAAHYSAYVHTCTYHFNHMYVRTCMSITCMCVHVHVCQSCTCMRSWSLCRPYLVYTTPRIFTIILMFRRLYSYLHL